jgi:5-(carboxyamino)imidazole ribonucleotide mutase
MAFELIATHFIVAIQWRNLTRRARDALLIFAGKRTDCAGFKPAGSRHEKDEMKKTNAGKPIVGIIMGSDSDWPVMKSAAEACAEFGIAHESRVISAHRTPQDLSEYATTAHSRGLRVIIAGAGGAAHLPGVTAAFTPLPVIGVPIESKALKGLDSLLSIVQMPSGIPVATVAIGGARNAGLLAAQILAVGDPALLKRVLDFKQRLAEESRAKNLNLGK